MHEIQSRLDIGKVYVSFRDQDTRLLSAKNARRGVQPPRRGISLILAQGIYPQIEIDMKKKEREKNMKHKAEKYFFDILFSLFLHQSKREKKLRIILYRRENFQITSYFPRIQFCVCPIETSVLIYAENLPAKKISIKEISQISLSLSRITFPTVP